MCVFLSVTASGQVVFLLFFFLIVSHVKRVILTE